MRATLFHQIQRIARAALANRYATRKEDARPVA
jgi:hypothetical protein